MREVVYGGTVLITGDEIAAALLGVVMRVSQSGRAERVEVPCRRAEASSEVTSAEVIVVPGAPMIAVPVYEAENDLVDTIAVARLRARPIPAHARSYEPAGSIVDPNASYDFDEWI